METELETLTEEIIAEEQEQLDEMAGTVAKKVVGGVAKKLHLKLQKEQKALVECLRKE